MHKKYSENTISRISFIAVVILFSAIGYFQYGFFNLCDDAFIYLQYARNIVNNGNIAFNNGTITYGFTSPLWLFQITSLGYIFNDLLIIPTLLSFLYAFFYLVISWKIVCSIVRNSYLRFILLFLIAMDPNLSKHSFLGLETTMVYFVVAILLFEIFLNNKKNLFKIGILEGIAFLVRPDILILIGITNIYLLFRNTEKSSSLFKLFLGCSIIFIPWLIFAYSYFGNIFPATYYAKGGDYPFGLRFLQNIFDSALIFGSSYFVIFGYILWNLIRFWKKEFSARKNEISFILIITVISYVVFYSLTMSNEFIFSRYFVIVSPMIFLSIAEIISDKIHSNRIKIFFIGTLISFLITSFLHSTIYRTIYIESEKTEDELVDWTLIHTKPHDKIYRDRIGKIAFKTNRTLVDPVGLINKEISKYRLSNDLKSFYSITKPDYLLGPKKQELELFQKYFDNNVILIDSIKSRKHFLVRQILADEINNMVISNIYLKIYKINWD